MVPSKPTPFHTYTEKHNSRPEIEHVGDEAPVKAREAACTTAH
jgi:hypothetical protein